MHCASKVSVNHVYLSLFVYSTLRRKVKRPSAAGVNFLAKFFRIKSKFIQHYEFLEKLEDFFGKSCWRARSCSLITSFIQMVLLIQGFP